MSSNNIEGSNESFKEAITEEINNSQVVKEDNNDINKNIVDSINDGGEKTNQDNKTQDDNNDNNVDEVKEDIKEKINEENEKIDENNIKEKEEEVEKEIEPEKIEKIEEVKEKNNKVENEVEKEIEKEKEVEVEKTVEKEVETEKENIPDIVVDNNENNEGENENENKTEENIPAIVIDNVDVDNNVEKGEEIEIEKEENIADNLEIKGDFHDIFNKNLSEDTTELKRTLSNLYDKIKILSKDNINTVGLTDDDNDNKDKDFVLNELNATEIDPNKLKTDADLHKYYQSFSGTLQHFKPMTMPSTELCNTINNRYHNNINIQEFFEHLEKITTQNAYAINNSLSSLVSLMHGSSRSFSSQLDVNSGSNHGDALKHPKKGLNNVDAGLSKNFRNFFKYTKKKFNHNNSVFVSNITNDTIPIPNINLPCLPSVEELAMRDPLSLGIYYHNHQQYDIADYYFTLSSIDNNALGLYLHGMYIKYGHGISGCSPELGFQYLLKSAEASIQSIPTVNRNNMHMTSKLGTIDEDHNRKSGSETDIFKLNKVKINDNKEEESNELIAEKMLMKTNIANMLTKLTDEEFETWIVRCIVSLPIYEIGQSFLHGHGVPKSTSKAVYCFNVAAYMGDADAQIALAQCYKLGIGVKKTRKMASMWFRKAHTNGKCIFGESWVWKSKYDLN